MVTYTVNLFHNITDAVIGFTEQIVYTEEKGTLNIAVLIETLGLFEAELTVELNLIPTALARK